MRTFGLNYYSIPSSYDRSTNYSIINKKGFSEDSNEEHTNEDFYNKNFEENKSSDDNENNTNFTMSKNLEVVFNNFYQYKENKDKYIKVNDIYKKNNYEFQHKETLDLQNINKIV